jgi:hypothetical protein
MLNAASFMAPDLVTAYMDELAELLTAALAEVVPDGARQAAAVLLTFVRGLEDDLRDVDAVRRELRAGVEMITRGALALSPASPTGSTA